MPLVDAAVATFFVVFLTLTLARGRGVQSGSILQRHQHIPGRSLIQLGYSMPWTGHCFIPMIKSINCRLKAVNATSNQQVEVREKATLPKFTPLPPTAAEPLPPPPPIAFTPPTTTTQTQPTLPANPVHPKAAQRSPHQPPTLQIVTPQPRPMECIKPSHQERSSSTSRARCGRRSAPQCNIDDSEIPSQF